MHFVCLTIGSRGDVQPYIALGLGLKAQGHRVTIVTHEEYKDWVEKWGIGHRTAGGDPGALMKLSVEHKVCDTSRGVMQAKDYSHVRCTCCQMFSPQFFKESLHNVRLAFLFCVYIRLFISFDSSEVGSMIVRDFLICLR